MDIHEIYAKSRSWRSLRVISFWRWSGLTFTVIWKSQSPMQGHFKQAITIMTIALVLQCFGIKCDCSSETVKYMAKVTTEHKYKSYEFCLMAPSSMTLEHVSRSNQETMTSPRREIYVCGSGHQQRYPICFVPWKTFRREILALAEVCALWVLSSYYHEVNIIPTFPFYIVFCRAMLYIARSCHRAVSIRLSISHVGVLYRNE